MTLTPEDIYPKYRVIKKYDYYIVEECKYSPEERMRAHRFMPEWELATHDFFRWKWSATNYANHRIRKDNLYKARQQHKDHVVWGPEP